MVPVMGYVCRICHKFYHSNSEAKISHCKSLAHFENLQVSWASRPTPPCPAQDSASIQINGSDGQWPLPPCAGHQSSGTPHSREALPTKGVRKSGWGWTSLFFLQGVRGWC